MADAVGRLNTTARSLRPRADDEVPTEVGVCIDGAFVAKPLGIEGENFALGIRLKEFPDVHFSIDTRVASREAEQETIVGMQRRLKDAEHDAGQLGFGAWYAGIKFLRRGEREVNGSKGYEVLARKPAQGGGSENHEFHFESGGEADNELKPAVDMQLDTGADNEQAARVPPSLTDEEAVAVWDKLVGSIRVRPTSGTVKTSQAAPPKAPLGELAVTGRSCPQTGWWECDDPLDLAQASRVWLQEGQPMPKAVVRVKPTAWERLRGERPLGSMPAMWRLAAYEAETAPGESPSGAAPAPAGDASANSAAGAGPTPGGA